MWNPFTFILSSQFKNLISYEHFKTMAMYYALYVKPLIFPEKERKLLLNVFFFFFFLNLYKQVLFWTEKTAPLCLVLCCDSKSLIFLFTMCNFLYVILRNMINLKNLAPCHHFNFMLYVNESIDIDLNENPCTNFVRILQLVKFIEKGSLLGFYWIFLVSYVFIIFFNMFVSVLCFAESAVESLRV